MYLSQTFKFSGQIFKRFILISNLVIGLMNELTELNVKASSPWRDWNFHQSFAYGCPQRESYWTKERDKERLKRLHNICYSY